MKNFIHPFAITLLTICLTAFNALAQNECTDRCLYFDGQDDFLQASFAPFSGDADFTVEAWVQSYATETGCGGTYRRIIGINGPGTRFELGDCSGNLNLFTYDGTNNVGPVSLGGNLRDGAWHHVAASRQNGQVEVFLDGVSVYIDNLPYVFNMNQFRVGKWGGGGSDQEWKGLLDEVRVWNYARSSNEIKANMNCHLSGGELGMLLYYDFNEGAPWGNNTGISAVNDLTPNGNDGIFSPGYMGSTGFNLSGGNSNYVCPGAPVGPCGPCTKVWSVRPDSTSGKDACVHELASYQNSNFGNAPQFYALSWTFQGDPASLREYFEYDLSAIPAGANIISASLDLYGLTQPNGATHSCLSGPNDAWIRRVTTPWSENTITWNNQPGTTTTGQIYVPQLCTPSANNTINVTTMVQDMVNNPALNYGFQMLLNTESYYRAQIYHSSDATDPLKRPRLTVVYEVACPCENNLVQNGTFSNGATQGNLGGGGTLSNWTTLDNSPQVILYEQCADPGAIQMWGNQVVGESIIQPVNFNAGNTYQLSFCGSWLNTVQPDVRIRFRAWTSAPGSAYGPCAGNCDEIYLSPILTTGWGTYTAPAWTPAQNYSHLTVSISNNYAINDGAYVSWARVDDICITRSDVTGTDDLTESTKLDASVYPNPNDGNFTLSFAEPLANDAIVTVMDWTGRQLEQTTLQQGETARAFFLQDHPAGMYLVRVWSNGRPLWTGKVVRQ